MAVVMFVLFLYLDAVLPREYGIPKHPLFFLQDIRRAFQKKDDREIRASALQAIDHVMEDSDVARMRMEVDEGHYSVEDPLVTRHLRKVYDSGKVALVDLNLIIRRGTCFGLLGENGAV